ncbi:hypothetical protein H4R33_000689 [Dimargaris cristalligena]|uniref:Elongation factor 1-gamma n=1 Tax=Dimargaris cristalligena TaxID=215637 RepID=A0A4Q0A2G7_9FUNG|nr:hypothetical protein H4R33_000689 [Dimargaris cristalligena]RKP40305.1 hypothetical protein BJ085DRAFT_42639 [Dimargaris cristalligena]|eukprot:RKP40305.1 hypothetical protein BJ085DRAFT_42639 [Dimargaris cristalligena]
MSSVGTLYSPLVNFRAYKARVAAEYNDLKIDLTPEYTSETRASAEYLAKFPLGKSPGFTTADGQNIFDSNAIAYYLAGLKKDTQLLGKDHLETTQIVQFMMFAESELVSPLMTWFLPILGFVPYNRPVVTKAKEEAVRALTFLNNVLLDRTFLVGERVTLADIVVVCNMIVAYKRAFDPKFRAPFKNLNRYFLTVVNQPQFAKIIGAVELCSEEPVMAAPKKEPKAKKEAAKPKAEAAPKKEAAPAPAQDDEEEKPAAPKGKNPLDLLPPSPFNLEDWKRFYSNNDTKPAAMNYFWEHFDPEGFSLWKVNFKYNDELTRTYMSNNQIGGFFARLERARKYAFGSLLVLGTDNDNEISGYFVVRGQEVPYEIYDAADYESYDFAKVDPTDAKIKEEVGDYFAWEGPTLPKPCADGKVFK